MSDFPVIFDQLSPDGIKYRGPTRLAGWELVDVLRGYPINVAPSIREHPAVTDALNRIVKAVTK